MAAWGHNLINASHWIGHFLSSDDQLINQLYIYKLLVFNSHELQAHKISIYDNIIYRLINSTVLILLANKPLTSVQFFCFLCRRDYGVTNFNSQ